MADYISKSSGERYKHFIEEATVNLSQHMYDLFIEVNCEHYHKAGIRSLIIRRQLARCCDWCSSIAGIYEYSSGEYPEEVFSRHENCRCLVTVKTEKGGYQNVWTKIEYKSQREVRIEREKEIQKKEETNRAAIADLFKKAKSEKGKIVFDIGYVEREDHKNKLRMAQWMADNLGGEVKLLAENNETKTADLLWNGEHWELKNLTTAQAANSAVRKAIKQITASDNPGGILLDLEDMKIDIEEMISIIDARVRSSYRGEKPLKIYIFRGGELIQGLWYDKK